MNIPFKKLTLLIVTLILGFSYASAAKIVLEAPSVTSNSGQPITVEVLLDAEGDIISGVSGNFSFPADLFEVESISTRSSIVSLWVMQPKISDERYLDGRTHITFEGIFPGGYDGVRGAYYEATKPGVMYTVSLRPKTIGVGTLVVDDIVINSFSQDAQPLPVSSYIKDIRVPQVPVMKERKEGELRRVENTTLNAFVTRSELVNRNAWYLVVNERESVSSMSRVYVAESEQTSPELLKEREWREVVTPHVLLYQDRTKYIHVKIIYSDGTFLLRTLPPVENSESISLKSRILVSVIALLFVAYFYGQHALSLFRKKI